MASAGFRRSGTHREAWPSLIEDRPRIGGRSLAWGAVSVLALTAMIAGALYADGEQALAARDPETLCRTAVAAPRATLVLLDQTDALAEGSGARFLSLMRRVKADLPRDARLTIISFGGDLGAPLVPVIDICSPGTGSEANELVESRVSAQRVYDTRFTGRLERLARDLQAPHESPYSPIAQQIERAVNDPALNWRGEARELIIMSDGLQHVAGSGLYAGRPIRLPPPTPGLLRGVTVRYYELANPTRSDLQTAAMRAAWLEWFRACGAEVRMYAPGYPAPDA